MHVIVDLPAVRPARLASALRDDPLDETVRELRAWLVGARREPLAEGVRLVLRLDVAQIAELADRVRGLADVWPFLTFRLLADPPECWFEVTGTGPAAELARSVFGEIAA